MRAPWTLTLAFAGALTLAPACSCGDDGDQPVVDGAPGVDAPIDGPEDTATRSGTVTLAQVSLKDDNQAVIDADVRGADFTIAYEDLASLGVTPSFQDDPATGMGCTVFEFSGPGMEAARVDEGPISVTGFADLGDFSCVFDSGRYVCSPATGAAGTVGAGSSLTPTGMGLVTASINGNDFSAVGESGARGMSITFPPGTWMSGVNDGTFPVTELDPDLTNVITIVNHGTAAVDGRNMANDFSITLGNGPVPADSNGAPYHLFASNNGAFSIAGGSDESGVIAAFSETITPATITTLADAELNVRLVDSGGVDQGPFLPHDLPNTEFTISCDETSAGNCESGSPVSALIVEGRTTDGALPSTGIALEDETGMPDPVGTYTTFRCVFLGQKIGTISQGALDAIHAGSPTRIETRVLYASGAILTDDDGNRVELLSGYGLVGYTDPQ